MTRDEFYGAMHEHTITAPSLQEAVIRVLPDDVPPMELYGLIVECGLQDAPHSTGGRTLSFDAFMRDVLRTHVLTYAFEQGWVDERAQRQEVEQPVEDIAT